MVNPQMHVKLVSGDAQLQAQIVGSDDSSAWSLGEDGDIVFFMRSSALSADAEVTGLIEGTSDHQGVAADSLIVSNITDDGDMMFLVSDGGNSKEFLYANGDTADLQLGHGMATATLKTASGDLTLNPGGNIVVSSALNGGTDGSGIDVVLYSGTAGDNLTWDASEEVLQITGTDAATSLDVLDGDVRIVDKLYFYDRGGEYISSDGSALTITGATTVSGGLTSTAASNTFGTSSFNDADITNVGDIALDSLSADGSTIDINNNVSIKGTTPKLTIGDGGTEDTTLLFNADAVDAYMAIDDTDDKLHFGIGSTVGSNQMANFSLSTNALQISRFQIRGNPVEPTLTAGAAAVYIMFDIENSDATVTAGTQITSLWTTMRIQENRISCASAITVDKATMIGVYGAPKPDSNVTITAASGIRILNNSAPDGTMTTLYGMYIENLTRGGTNVGLLTFNPVRIGADSSNNGIDDASNGSGTTPLYIGNAQITVSSDARLKEGIRPTQIDALKLVDNLNVVDFEWDDPTDESEYGKNYRGTYTGMVAQDTVKHAPWIINDQGGGRDCADCMAGDECKEHGMFQVEYQHLVPTLVKAIQELNRKVEVMNGNR